MSSHEESSLRFTETNSSEDSKGKTWGLEGNLFWFAIGGVFSAVMLLLILFAVFKMSIGLASGIALIPLLLSFTYIFLFRQGKPPGYDRDFFDNLLNGKSFSPRLLDKQPKRPFIP